MLSHDDFFNGTRMQQSVMIHITIIAESHISAVYDDFIAQDGRYKLNFSSLINPTPSSIYNSITKKKKLEKSRHLHNSLYLCLQKKSLQGYSTNHLKIHSSLFFFVAQRCQKGRPRDPLSLSDNLATLPPSCSH